MPAISIIIPVYNGGVEFQRCLAAIGHSTITPHELIVVNDGSTDASGQWAESAGAYVLHTEQRASGPAAARNLGAQVATGELLFFVDADVEIRAETLAHINRVFAAQPALTALFGAYDDAPAAPNFLSQYKNLIHHYVHQNASAQASTFWSGCGAIRRETFLKFGGFSSRYAIPSIEDIELGTALTHAGHNILLDKTLQVKHLKRWTWRSLLHSDILARAVPWTRLILRMGRMPNDLNLQTSARVSVLLVYAALGALGLLPFAPILGGLALACALALLWLNRALYVWFAHKRGWLFTLGAAGMHWLYYFYSGFALGIGVLWHTWDTLSNNRK